jgi:PEP-CTERM motif
MTIVKRWVVAGTLGLALGTASAVPVTFTKLTGLAGGTLAGTAVYKADLSAFAGQSFASISIADASAGIGGSPGQFSGFDLDAIYFSAVDCADAACAQGAAITPLLDYTNALFSAGAQRAPADPALFGSNASLTVNNAVATLGAFDGESTTGPTAFGFLSMGDNGVLSINFFASTDISALRLYIGEVGDNGEVAASSITLSPNRVPAPGTLALMAAGLLALGVRRRRG